MLKRGMCMHFTTLICGTLHIGFSHVLLSENSVYDVEMEIETCK